MESLPLEILVLIAQQSHDVWYLMSTTIRDFGLFSIMPKIRSEAMKRFEIQEIVNQHQRYFKMRGNLHGMFYSRCLQSTGIYETFIPFLHGKPNGEQQFYFNGNLLSSNEYKNGLLHGKSKRFYVNGYLRRVDTFHVGCKVGETQFFSYHVKNESIKKIQ